MKDKIIDFLKEQVGDKPAIIGLSGGLDSAVVAYLAAQALNKDKIFAILSPANTNTEADLRLAKQVAENLDIAYEVIDIDDIVASFQKTTDFYQDKMVLGNLKARIRMCLLYGQANKLTGVVLGTGNKSEMMVGYFSKYGDGGVDILPLGGLYKTQVYELAKELGVPQEIIERPPTAGLWKNQSDEKELGMTYEKLDKILITIENNENLDNFVEQDVIKVKKMISNSEHKRNLPPISL